MKNSIIKSMTNADLVQNEELNNSTGESYIKTVLSTEIILYRLAQFLEEEDIKCLSLCSKEIHKLYHKQIKKLKMKKGIEISIISKKNFDEYEKLIELDLAEVCIKDYSFISKLEKLENLVLKGANISDISFLKKNKNIKELDLQGCENIKDYSFISNLKKLENLNLNYTNISDISFLEKNKNIKELNLKECKNIKDYSIISNLKKTKIYM